VEFDGHDNVQLSDESQTEQMGVAKWMEEAEDFVVGVLAEAEAGGYLFENGEKTERTATEQVRRDVRVMDDDL
jgi:hypothetical protein